MFIHKHTHTNKVTFSIQYKHDYNPEGEQEKQDITNLQTTTSHSPANLVLSHKVKAKVRSPFLQHNPECMSWDQQQEETGEQALARQDREGGGEKCPFTS